jgi:hypothetical protein
VNNDDRATRDSIADFLSNGTGGKSSPAVDGNGGDPVAADGKPATTPRTRQLRTSFRTAAFESRPLDGRPVGGSLEPASPGPDGAPATAARAKHFKGWRTSLQQTGGSPSTDKPVQPADASAAGGRVRGRGAAEPGPAAEGDRTTASSAGRRGRPKKDQTQAIPKLPKAIAKLIPRNGGDVASVASLSKLVPTETERSSATRLFREIGETFNKNRKKSKTAAYAAFRHDLMANLDTLIMGGAIDLKEATTIITNLEQYTKETEAESTETPATILGRWLRMDAVEVVGLSVETVEEVVEDEENSGEEIDELDSLPDPLHATDGH